MSSEALRFWESDTPFIVLGKTSKVQEEIIAERVERDSTAVIRRMSAGGVVVQGKGCLNFTLILSKIKNPEIITIASSYHFILKKVILALHDLGVHACFYPPCDLALAENSRKFSGNAQRRGKHFILHHGTILHHFDIGLAQAYLRLPSKTPSYRAGRSHQEFMANIDRNPQEIINSFLKVFKIKKSQHHLDAQELAHLDVLLKAQ